MPIEKGIVYYGIPPRPVEIPKPMEISSAPQVGSSPTTQTTIPAPRTSTSATPDIPTKASPIAPINIPWDRLAQVFKDPRATPAFYKFSLDFLTNLLTHHRMQQQLGLQKEQLAIQAKSKDITPLIQYANILENQISNMYERMQTISNEEFRIRLAHQIGLLRQKADAIHDYIYKAYGLPTPTTQLSEQTSALPQPQSKSSNRFLLREGTTDEAFPAYFLYNTLS